MPPMVNGIEIRGVGWKKEEMAPKFFDQFFSFGWHKTGELSTAVYECTMGGENGVADVLTLGLWEAFASPVEYYKGEKISLLITYDKEGHVASATHKSR